MASAASPPPPPPVPQEASPLPGPPPEEVKNTQEVKEDSSKSEKWAFIEPQPIREDQVRNAVSFLSHPKVRGSPIVHRRSFLERKGLTREEIDEAFRRVPDPPANEGTRNAILPEGKVSSSAQPQVEVSHQIISPQQSSKVQLSAGGPPPVVVQTRSYPHWSQLILGAGFIAAVGAGTGYLFQRILVPRMKTWIQEIVHEDGGELKTMEARGELQGKLVKLTPLEEAVAAAAAAANAASVVATEMASTSRELLKSRTEEWKQLKSMLKSIEMQTEELKNAYIDLQNLHSRPNGQIDERPSANSDRGYANRLQHNAPSVEQGQIRPLQNALKGTGFSDGPQISNGHPSSLKNYATDSDEDNYWWRQKKTESETFISPTHKQSTIKISEVEDISDEGKDMGNVYVSQSAAEASGRTKKVEIASVNGSGETNAFLSGRSSMGSVGRQGWVPPPVPQTVLPGALSAIRYKKPGIVDDVRPEITSKEKEMDSYTSPSELSEVAEHSAGKEIPSSSTKELIGEDEIEMLHTNIDGNVEAVQ